MLGPIEHGMAPRQHDGENKGEALGYADPSTSTAGWSQIELPQQIEAAGLMIDGAIWFRKVVELPASWSGKDLALNLTSIDDYDVTYFQRREDRFDW